MEQSWVKFYDGSADDLATMIPSSIFKRFNKTKIRLHDTNLLAKDTDFGHIPFPMSREKYAKTVESSRWHGPYEDSVYNSILIFSIINTGDN